MDYAFYQNVYQGDSLPPAQFGRLAARAEDVLQRLERVYVVKGEQEARQKAVCAMADVLYFFEQADAARLAGSVKVGQTSASHTNATLPDTSPAAQSSELYRCAGLYLEIFRGCGG